MLIEFSVENFRSIRERVTLSFVAQRGRTSAGARKGVLTNEEICHTFPAPSQKVDLLPVAGLFGANASGKSNILQALSLVKDFVLLGGKYGGYGGQFGEFVPFRLDAACENEPCTFTVSAYIKGDFYEYELAVNSERIVHEALRYLPAKARAPRTAYVVDYDPESATYQWALEGGRGIAKGHYELRQSWLGKEPFLQTFTKFDAAGLSGFALWFATSFPGVGIGEKAVSDMFMAIGFLKSRPELLRTVASMVRMADTGIDDLEVEGGDNGQPHRLIAVRHTSQGTVRWPFREESYGTQVLFPLLAKVVFALEWGTVAIVDELGANVHRNLAHMIIRLFKDRATNPKGAQLVFASHDATLLEDQFLRRDQIWLTERRSDGSTRLFPLTDFHPRNDLDLYRSYIEGRFGAVPILPTPSRLLSPDKMATAENPAPIAGAAAG